MEVIRGAESVWVDQGGRQASNGDPHDLIFFFILLPSPWIPHFFHHGIELIGMILASDLDGADAFASPDELIRKNTIRWSVAVFEFGKLPLLGEEQSI